MRTLVAAVLFLVLASPGLAQQSEVVVRSASLVQVSSGDQSPNITQVKSAAVYYISCTNVVYCGPQTTTGNSETTEYTFTSNLPLGRISDSVAFGIPPADHPIGLLGSSIASWMPSSGVSQSNLMSVIPVTTELKIDHATRFGIQEGLAFPTINLPSNNGGLNRESESPFTTSWTTFAFSNPSSSNLPMLAGAPSSHSASSGEVLEPNLACALSDSTIGQAADCALRFAPVPTIGLASAPPSLAASINGTSSILGQFLPTSTRSSSSLWPDTSLTLISFNSGGIRSDKMQDDGLISHFHSLSGTDPDELTRQMTALSERRANIVAWSILYSNGDEATVR